jgi:hypothetical protein
MAPKKKLKDTPAAQSARFIEAAKKAEADERPEEFDKVLKSIAKTAGSKKTKSKT